MKLSKEFIQIIAAIVALFGFLTGYHSLPMIFGNPPELGEVASISNSFNTSTKYVLLLVGFPILSLLNIWVVISSMKLIIELMYALGFNLKPNYINQIYPHRAMFGLAGLFILLPIITGINIIFTNSFFGGFNSFLAYLMFFITLIISGLFFIQWTNDWKPRVIKTKEMEELEAIINDDSIGERRKMIARMELKRLKK